MSRKACILFAITILILSVSACRAQPQNEPSAAPTQILEPAFTQPAGDLPLTEEEVPRVTVEEAKAALDSGAAIIVDVRSPDAYETNHIAGAINIPLGEFETNPANLNLDKDEWIITYCT